MVKKFTKIVGILNITPDSFSDGGKFYEKKLAIEQLKKMLYEGADVIDIGAESTRPNAQKLNGQEEFKRLENILPEIIYEITKFNNNQEKQVKASIDSYHFTTIVKSYEIGIKIVNDVSGLVDDNIIEFIAKNNILTILMHNLAIHANPDVVINQDLNINNEIINFAQEKILNLQKKGIKKSQLIFDPGIGFSKNAGQSLRIIKNIDSYRVLGLDLFIGHSKKSFLDAIDLPLDRAQKTLEITKFLARKKIEYIRVHDVKSNLESLANLENL